MCTAGQLDWLQKAYSKMTENMKVFARDVDC